jgi:hypothetical protein
MNARLQLAPPWLRRVLGGALPRRPRFDPRSVHVRFVVEKSGTVTGFYRSILFAPVSIIPPVMHAQLHLHDALTGRTNRRSKLGSRGQKTLSRFVDCKRPCRVPGLCAVAEFNISDAEPLDAARSELDTIGMHEGLRISVSTVLSRKRGVERTEQLLCNATALAV